MTLQTPLVRRFRIIGLQGYKDVDLEFNSAAKIVIAENGSGKTTILSALQAFLDCQFERLERLQFEAIECEVEGALFPFVLHKHMLPQGLDPKVSERLELLAQHTSYDVRTIRAAILDLPSDSPLSLQSSDILREVFAQSPLDWDDIGSVVNEIREQLSQAQPDELKGLARQVQEALATVEILYLPTYRRVELPMIRSERETERVRRIPDSRFLRAPFPGNRSKWERHGIQFGLADVENRLSTLFSEIQRQSNLGYRSISANIIDELLAGRIARESSEEAHLPDIEALQRFLSRIDAGSRSHLVIHRSDPDKRFRAVQVLYDSGEINNSRNEELRYFLTKLSKVVDETREVESNIEQFVAKANIYLQESSDRKLLQYDARTMKVVVRSEWTSSEIKLDELSSGEKQVISLLAHLYLYDKKKFVLIDEPELSLSIDWQKRLLPDVLGSPTCRQLFAITHSPFIFDNELDPFAGPLNIKRNKRPRDN